MSEDTAVRYKDAVLYDDDCSKFVGDILIHKDGSWSKSIGDEDVSHELDGRNKLITRSLQNWHTHLAMQLNARDFSDGYDLNRWLNEAIFPTEARLNPEYVKIGATAAVCELIATGCSFAADMYFYPATTGKVVQNAGIRGLIGGPVSDFALPSHPDAKSALDELEGLLKSQNEDQNVNYAIATHSVYLCSEDTLLRAADLAEKSNGRLHIHVSETRKEVADCYEKTGFYPIEYLESLDFFKPGTICAHASWVKKNEIRILKQRNATAVHCPSSNMKLACGGTLSLPAYQNENVDVRLGTDGSASSGNGLNMLAEARMASLIQRHDHWDATILPAVEAFKMITKGSQDWVAWDLNDYRMHPRGRSDNRHISNLIFNGGNCLDMWVRGQAIRLNGITQTLDESKALEELQLSVESYYEGLE